MSTPSVGSGSAAPHVDHEMLDAVNGSIAFMLNEGDDRQAAVNAVAQMILDNYPEVATAITKQHLIDAGGLPYEHAVANVRAAADSVCPNPEYFDTVIALAEEKPIGNFLSFPDRRNMEYLSEKKQELFGKLKNWRPTWNTLEALAKYLVNEDKPDIIRRRSLILAFSLCEEFNVPCKNGTIRFFLPFREMNSRPLTEGTRWSDVDRVHMAVSNMGRCSQDSLDKVAEVCTTAGVKAGYERGGF